jgi:DNA-binding response OmpR family regulator
MGLALGAAEHLTKPIAPQELVRLLARVRRSNGATDVLIVDDDEGTREVIRRALIREGWTVREAENGTAGLAELATAKPAVVLLDLMMPEMNGFQLVAEMQKNPAWRRIPVIVITARDLTVEDRARLDSGIETVLMKESFSPASLIERVRQVVSEAHRTRKVPEVAS